MIQSFQFLRLAVNKLVAPDGWVDETMHIGRTGMFNIIKHNWDKWNVKEFGNILYDLKRRGVDDVEALPNYHYRDDAILIWDALNKYVDTVVKGIYGKYSSILLGSGRGAMGRASFNQQIAMVSGNPSDSPAPH